MISSHSSSGNPMLDDFSKMDAYRAFFALSRFDVLAI
jgi:hypothetical protein